MLSWGTNRSQSFSVILSHSQMEKIRAAGLNFGGVNFCECSQLLNMFRQKFFCFSCSLYGKYTYCMQSVTFFRARAFLLDI